MKILIVDDHQIVRYGLKLVLQGMNRDAAILEAGDLDCAVTLISNHDINLVIFNIDLPGTYRLEALIRFIVKESKVIIFSSYDKEHKLVEKLLFAGTHAFIFKDSSVSEIRELLVNML